MGGEGGVEDGAVGGREARTLGFQREPVVEDFWVAPGPEQDYVNEVLPAFIGFKVRPLGEVGTELKGNHLPLKTFGSGNIFKKSNNPYLVVAQNQEGPCEHDGHAEEEDKEDDDHGDGGHDSVPLLYVVVEVFAVAELIAVAVGYLEKALVPSLTTF